MINNPQHLPAAAIDHLLRDTRPYLSCDACFDRLDTYAEQMVSNPQHEDTAMQVHLLACSACAEEAEALIELISGAGTHGW